MRRRERLSVALLLAVLGSECGARTVALTLVATVLPVAAVLMMVALTRKVRLLPRGKARVCEIAPLPLAGQVAPPLPLQVQLRSVSSGGTVCAIVTPATSISALELLTVTV